MKTGPDILRRALKISANLLSDFEQWVQACELDRASGYRAQYCEHGMSQWTDYDNICGYCEDGVTMGDPMMRRRAALDEAHAEADWEAREEAAAEARIAELEAADERFKAWAGANGYQAAYDELIAYKA